MPRTRAATCCRVETQALRSRARRDFSSLPGVVEYGLLRVLLCFRPFSVAQRRERRVLFPDTNVARDEEALLQRHVEPRIIGESNDKDFLVVAGVIDPGYSGAWYGLHSFVAPNAVFEVDDEIVLVQLAEVDLGPAGLLPRATQREPTGARVAVAPEEFGVA